MQKSSSRAPVASVYTRFMSTVTHIPCFTRSSRPAPKFCPVKVVAAMLRLVTGRMLNPSIFIYAPQPAMALVPKTFTLDWTSTLEKEITIF